MIPPIVSNRPVTRLRAWPLLLRTGAFQLQHLASGSAVSIRASCKDQGCLPCRLEMGRRLLALLLEEVETMYASARRRAGQASS